jgi:Mg2+/Co2+ transporter CorB
MTLLIIEFCSLVVLLALSAFFSSCETAFFSLNPLQVRRIRATRPAAAARIEVLTSEPTRLLSTILIGNTLVNVTASTLGFSIAELFYPGRGEAIAVPVMTLLLLIFGEVGPKRIAMFWPERVSLLYADIFPVVAQLLTPLRVPLQTLTRQVEHLFQRRGLTLSEDEYASVVNMSGEEGVLAAEESAMVTAIMGLEELKVSDVMVPRVDISGIDLNDPPASCREVALAAGVRAIPLYCDDFDHIEAMLNVTPFLLDPDHILARACTEPFYVPETASLENVLSQFRKTGQRVAVAVDEYGGTSGVVTQGDILEEIVGDIGNEFTETRPLLQGIGPNRWVVDGSISLESLNQETGLRLHAEGADRLSGWVAAKAERLPRPGDTVHAQGCIAVVRQMRRNRITVVHIEKEEEVVAP